MIQKWMWQLKKQVTIDQAVAARVLREAASEQPDSPVFLEWVDTIQKFSKLCEDGTAKTHIAFLCTEILAKSVNKDVDLYAIKPKLAPGNSRAYSARSLCHGVIVKLSAELGFSIGVSGREPLNNQPYFRMTCLGDDTPVHAGGRDAFDYMCQLVTFLSEMEQEEEAREALRAFVHVRRQYQTKYASSVDAITITPNALASAIKTLVTQNSEGGKRAQAAAAGLLDVFAGTGRVDSGRINDPSRKYPGDVCVRKAEDPDAIEKAIEVRDKVVALSDIHIFVRKCVDMGVREAAVVMAAEGQPRFNEDDLAKWAQKYGAAVTLFYGWPSLVDQVLYWSEIPKLEGAVLAAEYIEERLIGVEADPQTVAAWQGLVRAQAVNTTSAE